MSNLLEDYRIQIMNQIIGFNPTGQLKLNSDGTIKFIGNISQVYTPQTLQASQLSSTSNNELVNNNRPVSVIENFEAFSMQPEHKLSVINEDKGEKMFDIKKIFYILLVVILILLIYMNIKKI
jgi:hypothetical protein